MLAHGWLTVARQRAHWEGQFTAPIGRFDFWPCPHVHDISSENKFHRKKIDEFIDMDNSLAHDVLVMDKRTSKNASTKSLLTTSQLAVLVAIRDYLRKHRVSPTYNEIATHISVTKNAVFQSVSILRRKGLLYCAPGCARKLVVTRAGHIEANKPRLALVCK